MCIRTLGWACVEVHSALLSAPVEVAHLVSAAVHFGRSCYLEPHIQATAERCVLFDEQAANDVIGL